MKKSKRRLGGSLLAVLAGLFTLIAYMYMNVTTVQAADNPYVYENPAWDGNTEEDIVQKITYVPQQDGTYGIKVYFDISHLDSQTVYNYAEEMGYTYQDHSDKLHYGTLDNLDYLDFLDARFESDVLTLGIEPGKEWSIRFYLTDGNYEWEDPMFSWITHTAPQLKDADKPAEPETPPAGVVVGEQDGVVTVSGVNKNHYGQVVYSGMLYLDSNTSLLCVELSHELVEPHDSNWKIVLIDPNGQEVTTVDYLYGEGAAWGSLDETKSGFSTGGYYTVKLISGYSGLGTIGYRLKFGVIQTVSYSYKYVSASAEKLSDGSYLIKGGKYDGNDVLKPAIYRENLSTKKFMCLAMDAEWAYDETSKKPDTSYKYYVVNYYRLTGTGLPTSSKEIAISDSVRAELNKYAATATIKTDPIKVANVTNLKVKKKGLKSVELEWFWDSNVFSGFVVKSYNSSGKLMATKYYKDGRVPGNTIYIPYKGTSKVKVTAYYNYDGKKLYGKTATISATSAKLQAPSVNITKISNTNARITVYRNGDGTQVQQLVGKKWKDVTTGSTSKTYKKTWTKNSAGKTTYRVRAYVKDQGKTYYTDWKKYTPKVNSRTYSKLSVSYVRNSYEYGDVYFFPTKVEYKGSKIKVTGRFYNTWKIASDSGKFKITYKADGKTIGTKTISVNNMKADSYKTTTFYLDNSKKNADLRCASYTLKTIK